MKKAVLIFALTAFAEEKARSIWDGVYTNAQAERGHVLYGAKCAECHGDDLEGDVVEAPALCGGEFLWKFNGATLEHIFIRIHRDMPLTRSGTLTREASADLLAYMLSASNLPAGKSELPHEEHLLRLIRIEAEKPRR